MIVAYNIYCVVIICVGFVDLCNSFRFKTGQMQIHGINERDTTKGNAVPYPTKEDSVYIPRVCSGPYCKSRTISKHNHQPVHIYVTPVPSARNHDHGYAKKKNKISPRRHTINPYVFQNPVLKTDDGILLDSFPLVNDKRNKREANDSFGEINLSNNPAVQANIDKIFRSTTNQHNTDTLLNKTDLQACIENIFNPKPRTLCITDENSYNVVQGNIVPANTTYSKSCQYPKLQTAIVNLYGPLVLPCFKVNKTQETKYQYEDTENAGQEYRMQEVGRLGEIYKQSVINESVTITRAFPRITTGPQIDVKTQVPTNDPELAQTILDVFGSPSISAATERPDTTESSHKVNTDPKSGNKNNTGDEDRIRSPQTIQNSFNRTSHTNNGANAQKTSFFFIYLLCLPTFVLVSILQ